MTTAHNVASSAMRTDAVIKVLIQLLVIPHCCLSCCTNLYRTLACRRTRTHARTHARPHAPTHTRTHCTVLVPLPKRSRGPFRCRRGKGARRVATQTACLDAKPAYASKSLNPRTLAKRVTSTLISSPNYSERPKHTHRNAACTSTPPVVARSTRRAVLASVVPCLLCRL